MSVTAQRALLDLVNGLTAIHVHATELIEDPDSRMTLAVASEYLAAVVGGDPPKARDLLTRLDQLVLPPPDERRTALDDE